MVYHSNYVMIRLEKKLIYMETAEICWNAMDSKLSSIWSACLTFVPVDPFTGMLQEGWWLGVYIYYMQNHTKKKGGFFLQMYVIKYVTVCSYIKHSTVGNHIVDVVCICWLFRPRNVELCCRLCPGLKPTRATSLLLWAAVVRGWCIGTIAFGSQKLISNSMPFIWF